MKRILVAAVCATVAVSGPAFAQQSNQSNNYLCTTNTSNPDRDPNDRNLVLPFCPPNWETLLMGTLVVGTIVTIAVLASNKSGGGVVAQKPVSP